MLRKARTLMDTAPLALISRSHSAGQARLAMCSMEFLFRRSSRKYRFLASALRGMKSMTLSWSHSLSKRGQLQYGRRRGLGTRFNRHAPHTTTAQPTHCSKPARPSMRLWYSLSSRRSRRESKPWMVMIELYDKSIVRSFGYCGKPASKTRSVKHTIPSPTPQPTEPTYLVQAPYFLYVLITAVQRILTGVRVRKQCLLRWQYRHVRK